MIYTYVKNRKAFYKLFKKQTIETFRLQLSPSERETFDEILTDDLYNKVTNFVVTMKVISKVITAYAVIFFLVHFITGSLAAAPQLVLSLIIFIVYDCLTEIFTLLTTKR